MSVAAIQSVIDLVGETVTLRREGTPDVDVTVKAKIIDYAATELAGNIIQGHSVARISDAEIAAAAWPGPPEHGDKIIRDGKFMHIESVETRELVRGWGSAYLAAPGLTAEEVTDMAKKMKPDEISAVLIKALSDVVYWDRYRRDQSDGSDVMRRARVALRKVGADPDGILQ